MLYSDLIHQRVLSENVKKKYLNAFLRYLRTDYFKTIVLLPKIFDLRSLW